MRSVLNNFVKRSWLRVFVAASFLFYSIVPPPALANIPFQLRTKSNYCVPTIPEQSVKALQSSLTLLHASSARELLFWLLEDEHLKLGPESFENFKDDFLTQLEWILNPSDSKELLSSLKEMFRDFERIGVYVMLRQLESLHQAVVPQMLSSTLKILLQERKIHLDGSLEDFRINLEKKFNLQRKKYGVQKTIQSVEVVVHEEDSLVENESKFILAPLTISKDGKAFFFIHKKLLKKMMEKDSWGDLLVAREYGILNFLEIEMDFEEAHRRILESEDQKILWDFALEVVREIVNSKPFPSKEGSSLSKVLPQDSLSWKFKPAQWVKIKKLIGNETIANRLRVKMASQIKKFHKQVVDERLTPGSVTFTFSDGGWLVILADEKEGVIELHVSATSVRSRERLFTVGEDLIRLLELWSREDEAFLQEEPDDGTVSNRKDPSIEKFRYALIQKEGSPDEVQKLPTLKKLLEFSRESGYSDSLVAEFFSPREVVETTLELPVQEDGTVKSVKAFYSSLQSGLAMAGMLAPLSTSMESIAVGLKDRVVQIALSIGLLQLSKVSGYGGIQTTLLDLPKKDIRKLLVQFGDKQFLSKIDHPSVMAEPIAKAAVVAAKYALVNMDLVDHDAFLKGEKDKNPPVLVGIQGLSQKGFEIANKARAEGFKVVAISKGGDDEKTYYKKDGFSETDLINFYRKTINPKAIVYKGEEFILEIEGIQVVFLTEGTSFLRAQNSELVARNGAKVKVEPSLLVEAEDGALEKGAKELLLAKVKETVAGESAKGNLKTLTPDQARKLFEKKATEHLKGRVYFLPSFLVMALGILSLNIGKDNSKERRRPAADIVTDACKKVFMEARIRFKASLEESFFLLEEASYLVALRGFIQLHTAEDRELLVYVVRNLENVALEGHAEVPKNFKEFVGALWKNHDSEALENLLGLIESPQEWANYRILLAYILDLLHSPSLSKEKGLALLRELLKIHEDVYLKESKPEKKFLKRLEKWGEKLPNTIAKSAKQMPPSQGPPYFGLGPGKGLAAFLMGVGLWGMSAFGSATSYAAELSSKILFSTLNPNWVEQIYPIPSEVVAAQLNSKVSYLLGEQRTKINKVEVWTFDLTSLIISSKTSVAVPMAVKQMVERIQEKPTPNSIKFALILNENLSEGLVLSIAKKLGIDSSSLVYSQTPQGIFRKVQRWGDVSMHVVTSNSRAWAGFNVSEIIQLLGSSVIDGKEWLGELNFKEKIPLFFKTQA